MNFDQNFIYDCLANDLGKSGKVKVLDSLEIDLNNRNVSGVLKLEHLNKENLKESICDHIGSEEFNYLVRYGLLCYKCYIKSENDFTIEIFHEEEGDFLEDITIEELVADDLHFFFYDNLINVKSNINSLSDFSAVIDALFHVVALPKGKNKTYSLFVSGLDLSKDNMMKLYDSRDQVPAVDHVTFADCDNVDKDFIKNYFERSTVISYK